MFWLGNIKKQTKIPQFTVKIKPCQPQQTPYFQSRVCFCSLIHFHLLCSQYCGSFTVALFILFSGVYKITSLVTPYQMV